MPCEQAGFSALRRDDKIPPGGLLASPDGDRCLMPLLLLLLLTVVCMPFRWPEPPNCVGALGSWVLESCGLNAFDQLSELVGSTLLTWLGVALEVALAAAQAQWVRWQVARDPGQREFLQHRYTSWRFYHLLSLFAVYGLALYVLGWGWVAQGAPVLDATEILPGSALLVLAPFLTALVLSWACFYDADRALHVAAPDSLARPPYWSRSAYLTFRVRQNLALVFIPVLLLVIVNDLPRLLPEAQGEVVAGLVTLLAALAVFVCIPWIVRLVLGLKPLPPGPLRNRLLAASRRLKVRCSDILLWNTRGGVANAMVVGILPLIRYVVLTDRLVAEMTPDEVEAVFGHEAGHVRHRHMLYYLGFLMVSLAVLAMISELAGVKDWWEHSSRQYLIAVPLAASLGSYIFVVFGFLSRRCERQADIFGCRAVSCARTDCTSHESAAVLHPAGGGLCPTGIRIFIGALEKVASLNGISRDRPGWLQSWQHSTIARRVEFLQRILADPRLEPRFQRTVLLVKLGMFFSLGALLLLLWRNGDWTALLRF
jgi:Zn-dependent protease with chaperone function